MNSITRTESNNTESSVIMHKNIEAIKQNNDNVTLKRVIVSLDEMSEG